MRSSIEIIEDRDRGLNITVDFIDGVQKWLDNWLSNFKDTSKDDIGGVINHYEELREYVALLSKDLVLDKGFWPGAMYGIREKDVAVSNVPFFVPENEALSKKIVWAINDIDSDLDKAIGYAYKIKFNGGVDDYKKEVVRSIAVAKSLHAGLSSMIDDIRVFIERWSSWANDKLKKQKAIESEFSIGRVKVVMNYTSGYRVSPLAFTKPVIEEHDAKLIVSQLDKAKMLLSKSGFGKMWYGIINVYPGDGSRRTESDTNMAASYSSKSDSMSVYVYPFMLHNLAYNIIHEFGHRWYYKFMSKGERARFDSYFGKVRSTSSYGGTKSSEDFAEVFASYVTGEKLDRDQKERFREYALNGKSIKRNEEKENTMRNLIEKIEGIEEEVTGIEKLIKDGEALTADEILEYCNSHNIKGKVISKKGKDVVVEYKLFGTSWKIKANPELQNIADEQNESYNGKNRQNSGLPIGYSMIDVDTIDGGSEVKLLMGSKVIAIAKVDPIGKKYGFDIIIDNKSIYKSSVFNRLVAAKSNAKHQLTELSYSGVKDFEPL